MHRSYTWAWVIIWTQVLIVEGIALYRRGRGDTLSEHVWAVSWLGFLVHPLLCWLLWHFSLGKGRPLGWPDLAAVFVGLVWAGFTYSYMRQ